jgi:hypothetical protein
VLTRNSKCKTPCEKSKNNSFFWKDGENHRTPAFPYTSSVTPTEGRSGFMAESLGGAKFKQLYETYKAELHPHRKSNQNLALPKPSKPRSRPSALREPRLADFTIGECKG